MENKNQNIKLEKQIDDYVKGKLTEEKAQKLWAELLKRPEYINQLQTEIDLTRYHQQQTAQKNSFGQYKHWFAAAAAVILIVAGINIFSSEALNDYTIEAILLRDNLATANVMRSGEPNFKTVDSLLNLGFQNAVNGKIEDALAVYNKVINKYPNSIYAAKAHLNIGILTYNSGNYEASIENFAQTLSIIDENPFIEEQAYWYIGNALINIEKFEQAREAIYKAVQLNGLHKQHALRLLKKLDRKLKE